MGAGSNDKEKRAGIWITKDGKEEKLQGVTQLKFYGKEERQEPRCIFNPRHICVPVETEIRLEKGEDGILIRFQDSETYEENQAIEEAKRVEDENQGPAFDIAKAGKP